MPICTDVTIPTIQIDIDGFFFPLFDVFGLISTISTSTISIPYHSDRKIVQRLV